jgi:hypothetical protein
MERNLTSFPEFMIFKMPGSHFPAGKQDELKEVHSGEVAMS